MAVLNTTSPAERPGAPAEMPSKIVPSSSARIAGWVTGIALAAGGTDPAAGNRLNAGCSKPRTRWWTGPRGGVQASGNCSDDGVEWPAPDAGRTDAATGPRPGARVPLPELSHGG